MALMRLQKFLSQAGVCSRRLGETYILEGRVQVNEKIVNSLGARVDPDADRVRVDGKPAVLRKQMVYIALNKPSGYVTTCSQAGEPIVLDLVDVGERVYPVGRLDRDSTGLLLLTNDGRIHHRLSHPSFDHEKEYEVTLAEPIFDGALQKMAAGLPMMGTRTRPAEVRRISARRFVIVLKEGRNRQIRRMVRKVGGRVTVLRRTRIANILLGDLPEGRWRHLSEAEVKSLTEGL
ncbi:MAG: pseudouridine synthase [Desulfobacterales bacterium]|nr:pseudouridine synthase [Desulfobacterales bacterium]MDD4462853.1 pseudouridine synthase [Desulfobacterales bacterium]